MSGVVLAALVFAATFLAHVLCSHLVNVALKERMLVRFLLAGALAYAGAYPVAMKSIPSLRRLIAAPPAVDFLTGLAAMGFLILGYIEFWSLVERSFSLRILIDAAAARDGLTRDEIARAYAGGRGIEWMMEKRVSDLVGSGMLVPGAGPPRLSARGRAVAVVFQVLQRIFHTH